MRFIPALSWISPLAFLLIGSVAVACQCIGDDPIPTPQEAYEAAGAVMEIEVVGASPYNEIMEWDLYYARVLRSWKGVTTVEVQITMPSVGACGFPMAPGTRRLIYGEGPVDRIVEGLAWFTSMCTRSAFYQSSADYEYLESLETVVPVDNSTWSAVKSMFAAGIDDDDSRVGGTR